MQNKPSSQGGPLGTGDATHWSVTSSQISVLHWSPAAVQSRAPPLQTPPVQTSPTLQNCPSSQAVPLASGWASHTSVVSLQMPALH